MVSAGKKVKASSVYLDYAPERITDGSWSTIFSSRMEFRPWITIDLVDVFEICYVRIFPADVRIQSLLITVGNYVEQQRNTACVRHASLSENTEAKCICTDGSLIGRYVHAKVYDAIARQLQLKEVLIYASP